jgi:tetratricopeptide (TPR) repeat protein
MARSRRSGGSSCTSVSRLWCLTPKSELATWRSARQNRMMKPPQSSRRAPLSLAARRGAPEAAAELFSVAKRLTPQHHDEERTRRGLGEAEALLAAGDVDSARKLASEAAGASAAGLRAEAELLLGDINWIGGSWSGAIEHLENALAAQPEDPALAARAYPKLVNYSTHDPTNEIERAERALAALSSEQVPAAVASVAFDLYWAELLLGHGARQELFKRWQELEDKAGADASKSVIPLIYFHSIDDFDGARERHAVESEWYRARGEEGWVAERLAHLGFVEFRAGRWELAERHVAELAASGLTNREVASKAFMSPRTVQANLARVYRKLGISSRAELGARMSEERGRVRAQT